MKYLFFFISITTFGKDFDYRDSTQLTPNDYFYKPNREEKDPVFDQYRSVDLDVNLGIGSDCGRVDFKNTLKASLKNTLDSKYFGDLGKDILASSPMLLTCYFSPTWCAILKHSQISANFMAQMRLNQCALIDKYTDSRVEDYYQERQKCAHKEIQNNGGDLESALQKCDKGDVFKANIANWAGNKYGDKVETNKLIESSAKWAGFQGKEADATVELVKALVGDTVISKGTVSVEYGPKRLALSPRSYLNEIENTTYAKLCKTLVPKIDKSTNLSRDVSDVELKDISGDSQKILIDRQTLKSLSYMPFKERSIACEKLSQAIAMTNFSLEMNKSLDVLNVATQNPNLPDNRKQEIEHKRNQLKDSVELTLQLQKQKVEPLNTVVSWINEQGESHLGSINQKEINHETNNMEEKSIQSKIFDCSDGMFCKRGE